MPLLYTKREIMKGEKSEEEFHGFYGFLLPVS